MTDRGAADRALFPPESIVEIKALACELPVRLGLPFSRLSHADIATEAVLRGIVVSISVKTVWRYLHTDAIKPWMHRTRLFPRDPLFAEKAVGVGPMPHQPRLLEFEYDRMGAWAYLAAWDVHRAELMGICEKTTGIESYHKLVDLVMQQEPYRSARRVFWITDNGSSHRGEASVQRLADWYPNAIPIHTPVHASWLNQIEIFFSILQRKILTPNDFPDLETLEATILQFQAFYNQIATPFNWRYTKDDLKKTLDKIQAQNDAIDQVRLAA